MKYLKYFSLIALYYVLYFYASSNEQLFRRIRILDIYPYLIVLIILVTTNIKFLSKRIKFWEVFSHELSHLIFAVLFFRKMTNFVVNEDSGMISYQGKGNWIISLAPYSMPFITMVLLAFAVVGGYENVTVKLVIIFSYSFYFSRMLQDFSWSQSDFEKTGLLFSTLWVVGINIIILLVILFYLQNDINFLLLPLR
ncbi:M50 family metallopeptidase [bacterium]|nr:M50 family metallopeptidase [bacterium]